jgi:uncharacterized protein (DUF58 family)
MTRPTPWWGEFNRVRPTAEGVWFFLLLAGVTFGAVNTGNNLVYLVLGTLLGLLIVSNVLAEWNLRGLTVRRELPPDIHAGEPATGRLVLENPRKRGAAWQVQVEELDGARGRATLLRCPPGGHADAPMTWTFPTRGTATLGRIRVGSRFPFGLIFRYRDLEAPAELVVWPAPEHGRPPDAIQGGAPSGTPAVARGATGEFAGLRPYVLGDPLRSVHWRTTARLGAPHVTLRTGEAGDEVVVRLERDLRGEAREAAIRRATGRVEVHLGRGDAVGLEADGEALAPGTGSSWRRVLLNRLALLAVVP